MSRRENYKIPGVSHARIPMAARVGPILRTSAIMGKDPATSELASDPAREVEFCFANAKAILDAAGLTPDDIVYMDVLLQDGSLREAVNKNWCAWYPSPDDRPARHTTVQDLPFGHSVELKFQAVFP